MEVSQLHTHKQICSRTLSVDVNGVIIIGLLLTCVEQCVSSSTKRLFRREQRPNANKLHFFTIHCNCVCRRARIHDLISKLYFSMVFFLSCWIFLSLISFLRIKTFRIETECKWCWDTIESKSKAYSRFYLLYVIFRVSFSRAQAYSLCEKSGSKL